MAPDQRHNRDIELCQELGESGRLGTERSPEMPVQRPAGHSYSPFYDTGDAWALNTLPS